MLFNRHTRTRRTRRIINDELDFLRSRRVVADILDGVYQIADAGFFGIVINRRFRGSEINRSLFNPGLFIQLLFDAVGARRAGHSRNRQINALACAERLRMVVAPPAYHVGVFQRFARFAVGRNGDGYRFTFFFRSGKLRRIRVEFLFADGRTKIISFAARYARSRRLFCVNCHPAHRVFHFCRNRHNPSLHYLCPVFA